MKTFRLNILTLKSRVFGGEVIVHAFEEHQIYISTTQQHVLIQDGQKPAGTLISMGVCRLASSNSCSYQSSDVSDDNDMGQVEQFLTIFKQFTLHCTCVRLADLIGLNNKTKFEFKRKGMTLTYSEKPMVRYRIVYWRQETVCALSIN